MICVLIKTNKGSNWRKRKTITDELHTVLYSTFICLINLKTTKEEFM